MPRARNPKSGLVDTWGRQNRKFANRPCLECGQLFHPRHAKSKYCSRPCAWANNGGRNKKQECWWKNAKGYIEGRIWLSDGTQIRVKQHRFVMEGLLNRPLSPSEDVHHLDGNKANNDPANLVLIDHGTHSAQTNRRRKHPKGYRLKLTPAERKARSLRAIARQLWTYGHAALAKADGKERT